MYLVFDTETTGLPRSWNAPASDVVNWPRVVQVAWEAFDDHGRKTDAQSHVIRPDGFTIPKRAEKVHGISTSIANERGVPVVKAIDAFVQGVFHSRVLVAHNLKFDMNVLGAEFHRLGMGDPFGGKTRSCTMQIATDFCKLPGRYGFKCPKLPELHSKLFGTLVKEMHQAAADVATCSKCFFELRRLGIV